MTKLEASFPTKQDNALETIEQQYLVQWLEVQGLKFTSIPNSTFSRSWNQKRKNKKEWLRPWLPDLLVLIPFTRSQVNRPICLWIELKRQKGWVVSEYQKDWIKHLNSLTDQEARVCKGAMEAVEFIKEYLIIK